jgi:hypothetical protein
LAARGVVIINSEPHGLPADATRLDKGILHRA